MHKSSSHMYDSIGKNNLIVKKLSHIKKRKENIKIGSLKNNEKAKKRDKHIKVVIRTYDRKEQKDWGKS